MLISYHSKKAYVIFMGCVRCAALIDYAIQTVNYLFELGAEDLSSVPNNKGSCKVVVKGRYSMLRRLAPP
jgi:hypothetical protein